MNKESKHITVFETIASFRDLPIAELARAKLLSENIECYLLNKYHIGVNWLYSEALGGVKLQVRKEDVDRALEILNRDESSCLEDENLEFPPPDVTDYCDKCGSTDLELVKYNRYSAALIILTQIFFLFWGTRFKCRKCGHRMKRSR